MELLNIWEKKKDKIKTNTGYLAFVLSKNIFDYILDAEISLSLFANVIGVRNIATENLLNNIRSMAHKTSSLPP